MVHTVLATTSFHREVAEYVGKPADQVNAIICHLGNGGSVSVVRHGKCIDTSMGLTPLEGLVMGTRCGDIDPAIVFYLYKNFRHVNGSNRRDLSEKNQVF